MSLETFHKLFVACAGLFSLLLCAWGVQQWAATGAFAGLAIAAAGGIAVTLLAIYARRSWLLPRSRQGGRA